MKITYHFCSSSSFISILIRFLTHGKYSHVAIWINWWVYEALEGVWVRRLAYEDRRAQSYLIESLSLDITKEESEMLDNWLFNQIWKKYDWRGVLQFVSFFRFKPQKMGYWYCSEIAMGTFEKLWLWPVTELIAPHRFYERAKYFILWKSHS